ncbi:hypothetical protein AB0J86_13690 [Micromonospora sp. NPDC049559]|uniref:hypothetical protein n=1 Tax=Micromonospora sp. NPDC049559 TaxID=3155923 RepID=UPI0034327F15
MSTDDQSQRRTSALGQPPRDRQPSRERRDPGANADPDFADEHRETAVSADVITGADVDREPESPRGWSGMQR